MIPLSKPLLPTADKLLPYLEVIDKTRWYTNAGPLVCEYERRIGEMMGCHVAAVSSATTGLTASLIINGHNGKRITLPAWSFVATANAVRGARQDAELEDVNEETWCGTSYIGTHPFGAPLDILHNLYDAAAAFDVYATGQNTVHYATPAVISTHATKCFSTAEGGLVLSQDANFIQRVKEIINHGLTLSRETPLPGINGKMSEYHAAIGLAELDGWEAKRYRWLMSKYKYLEAFGEMAHTTPLSSLAWVGPNFCIRHKNADAVRTELIKSGYMSRKVWGDGIHKYEAYKDAPCGDLSITERLAHEVVFLPYYLGIEDEHIEMMAAICASL